jgi:hypothetical protein
MTSNWFRGILLAIAAGLAPLAAQVQTDVPPAVAGAKPVAVEHIKNSRNGSGRQFGRRRG